MVPIRQTVFIWQGIIFCLSFHMKPYLKKIAKFDEPLKHDTYSPYISLIICIIFYYPLAIFWAITFENPSINEEMAAIWN